MRLAKVFLMAADLGRCNIFRPNVLAPIHIMKYPYYRVSDMTLNH
jgi:hypothetical protein